MTRRRGGAVCTFIPIAASAIRCSRPGPALFQMSTGTILAGAPSLGSWVTYGLGTENENLPGFIVFTDYRGGPINGAPNWGNGYMPAAYQGTPFRTSGAPIVDLKPPV